MEFVTLITNDNQEFTVEKRIAKECLTLKNIIEEVGTDESIPLSDVSGKNLIKVVEYAKHFFEKGTDENWEKEFCNVEQSVLFEMILASNYLNYPSLLDLTCKTVANMIKGKTPEEIRKTFDIANDFTEEEEEAVKKENEWCE